VGRVRKRGVTEMEDSGNICKEKHGRNVAKYGAVNRGEGVYTLVGGDKNGDRGWGNRVRERGNKR